MSSILSITNDREMPMIHDERKTRGDIKEETLRGRQASPDREEKRDGVAGSQVTELGGDWSGMGFSKDQLYATTCLKTWDGMVQTMATLYTAWSKPCLY